MNLIRWSSTAPEQAGKTVTMTFRLFADSAGGESLWRETQSVRVGPDGRYSVLLGTTSADGLPRELFEAGEARWIGVRIAEGLATDAIDATPATRFVLASVPYAFKSIDAETLGGHAASEFVTREDLRSSIDAAMGPIGSSRNAGSGAPSGGAAVTAFSGVGSAGIVPLWTGNGSLG
jgi:hypothetical protein